MQVDPSIDARTEGDLVNEMAFSDNTDNDSLFAPQAPAQRTDGVNSVSERGEDRARDEFMRELEEQPSRPLTDDEKRAAAADSGSAPSVYAPASERVPKEPLPGDRKIVDHMDSTTSERIAADAQTETAAAITTPDPPSRGDPGASDSSRPG